MLTHTVYSHIPVILIFQLTMFIDTLSNLAFYLFVLQRGRYKRLHDTSRYYYSAAVVRGAQGSETLGKPGSLPAIPFSQGG